MVSMQELQIPSAVDTERALLGSILLDSDQLMSAIEILPPGAGHFFYNHSHNLIYDAMLTLMERNTPIDMLTVTDVLRRRGVLDKIGGVVYLAELTECAVTTANTTHHARIIREKSLYRAVINLSTDLGASAHEQESLPDILNRAQEVIMGISGAQQNSGFSSMHHVMMDSIRQAQHAETRDMTGIHTGFHELDVLTSGFQPGNLIILAGRPSQGKSALAMQFAISAARTLEDVPVTFFSLEMSSQELGMRVLCGEAGVDSSRMKRGLLAQDEWGRLMNAGNQLGELGILIDDTSSLSVLDVRARARRLQNERGLGMVIIDYLQLMAGGPKRAENRQQEVSTISRELKLLAKDLNVPVIALSQLNREVEHKNPPIPALSDLRDSGSLEQDADVVMFIYRGDIFEPNNPSIGAKLLLSKQRNGPTGEVMLSFDSVHVRFSPRTEYNDHQPF